MAGRGDLPASALGGFELPERYLLLRRIARGGMGSVWCARDQALDREVAVKVLAEPFAHDAVAVRRFKREARAAARLSAHPHVVTIYDVGQAAASDDGPGRPFIVMEHLAGGSVADALRVSAVEPEEALRWLHEAAAALDYAHRKGVIHRDVKPSNFLLDRDRSLHVADFGIARLGTEDTLTGTGQVLGTSAYLAPERALGQPATEASDRYALAIVAFELLTGERPFTAEHFAAQARQHIEDPPPRASVRNPALPRALDPVLARGMDKRPERRWPTAVEMADAIERAVTGGSVSLSRSTVRLPRAAARTGAAPGRRTAAVAALAVVALGVGIAAGASGPASTPHHRQVASVHAISPPAGPRQPARSTAANRPPPPRAATKTATAQTPTTATPAPPSAGALEAQGHQLMLGGNYTAAIGVLQKAVAAASPGSLTDAYALFDLGHSLRLAGDPQAAVPVLWRRLQIPNQTGVVRAELTLALQELGQQTAGSGGASPAPHHGHHKGHTAAGGEGD